MLELRSKRPANVANVELFSLVKILSLSTEKAKEKPSEKQSAPKPGLMAAFLSTEAQTLRGTKPKLEDAPVTIELCANGGHEGHDFIALYLSNGKFFSVSPHTRVNCLIFVSQITLFSDMWERAVFQQCVNYRGIGYTPSLSSYLQLLRDS